jgi:hypothetical protein
MEFFNHILLAAEWIWISQFTNAVRTNKGVHVLVFSKVNNSALRRNCAQSVVRQKVKLREAVEVSRLIVEAWIFYDLHDLRLRLLWMGEGRRAKQE